MRKFFDFRNKVYFLSRCYFIILNINFYKWNYQAFVHRTGYYLVTSSVMVVVILVNISAISMTPKWWIRAKNYTHQLVCCHSWATNMWCISITKKKQKKNMWCINLKDLPKPAELNDHDISNKTMVSSHFFLIDHHVKTRWPPFYLPSSPPQIHQRIHPFACENPTSSITI